VPSIIYALVDPRDNKEFYVGRTEDLYRRFAQHLRCGGANDAKNSRIRELKSLHLLPIMKTLEVIHDAALAAQREAYWIHHFRYLKIQLVNDVIYQQTDTQSIDTGSEEIKPIKVKSPKRKANLKEKMKKNIYTVDEAAKLAGCGIKQIWQALEDGHLITSKSGSGILKSSLEKFIIEQRSVKRGISAI
jgi:hypothetical protein